MENKDVVSQNPSDIENSVTLYESGLAIFLQSLGLPSKNILVPIEERNTALMNLPKVINRLQDASKNNSIYLSKFVAALGAGLFDAALNYLWDETIKNLRSKVIHFDLEYFYSSTITDPDRLKKFKSEDDLVKLDDWELIKGCLLTGLLSEIGYKHLDYIRDMRNWASAAHPNQNELTGLEIVTWLQTCIKEVIAREPIASAIEIKRLLHNIRSQVLNTNDVSPVEEHMALMPTDIAVSFLRTIFGMFTDVNVIVNVKTNIKLVAKQAWAVSPEDIRYELGIKYRTFAANAEIQRRDSAREFLEHVDGLTYLPSETFQLEMSQAIQDLYSAHIGYNNFHNEPSHVRILRRYIPETGKVPKELLFKYVKTISMCSIGNGFGVSEAAYPYYLELLNLFQDLEILYFCYLPKISEFSSRLQLKDCQIRFKGIVEMFKPRTANPKCQTLLELYSGTANNSLRNLPSTAEFNDIFPAKRINRKGK